MKGRTSLHSKQQVRSKNKKEVSDHLHNIAQVAELDQAHKVEDRNCNINNNNKTLPSQTLHNSIKMPDRLTTNLINNLKIKMLVVVVVVPNKLNLRNKKYLVLSENIILLRIFKILHASSSQIRTQH